MRTEFIKNLITQERVKKNIFLLVADIGYGVVEEFQQEFPDRFINVGVAEQNMTGIAAGLASEGYHVFTYSIANFPTFRCAEQIRNDIDYHNLPVTIVSVGGGLAYGSLGYSHHAIQDYGLLRMMPNFSIASPGDPNEVKVTLKYLINNPGPSYLRLGKNNETSYTSEKATIKPGKWYGLKDNTGTEEVILSTGTALQWIMQNKKNFHNKDIFTIPIWGAKHKKEQLELSSNFSSITTVEDHIHDCGFGSWFKEAVSIKKSNKEISNFALPLEIQYIVGKQEDIMKKMSINN